MDNQKHRGSHPYKFDDSSIQLHDRKLVLEENQAVLMIIVISFMLSLIQSKWILVSLIQWKWTLVRQKHYCYDIWYLWDKMYASPKVTCNFYQEIVISWQQNEQLLQFMQDPLFVYEKGYIYRVLYISAGALILPLLWVTYLTQTDRCHQRKLKVDSI